MQRHAHNSKILRHAQNKWRFSTNHDDWPATVASTSQQSRDRAPVVEYEGVITNIEPHGNAKRCNAPYIRTHPATIGKIEDQLRERKQTRDIYISLWENDDVHKTAKRLRQVHIIKQRITKEQNQPRE